MALNGKASGHHPEAYHAFLGHRLQVDSEAMQK